MKIAQVAVLRKLKRGLTFFSYILPDEEKYSVGQMVKVNFGGKNILGIIWRLGADSKDGKSVRLKNILGVVSRGPVMTPYQMKAIEEVSDRYGISVSSLLVDVIPEKAGTWPMDLSGDFVNNAKTKLKKSPLWWYSQRQNVVNKVKEWLEKPGDAIRLVMVPTLYDLVEITNGLKGVVAAHGQMGQSAYSQLYRDVLCGKVKRIVGTSKIFFLPYPKSPDWVIDQVEHRQYKLAKRWPKINYAKALRQIDGAIMTSPAPSLEAYQRGAIPPSRRINRMIGTLRRGWISPEAELRGPDGGSTVWVLPGDKENLNLICRQCGNVVNCRKCGKKWRAQKNEPAVCQYCKQKGFNGQCPRCRSWNIAKIGVDKEMLAGEIKSSSFNPAHNIFDTYRVYRRLKNIKAPVTVIIVNGEMLRTGSDFAATENAWEYINRLEANLAPKDTLIIQTRQPADDFWQDWKHQRVSNFYRKEIAVRKSLKLPPAQTYWEIRNLDGISDDQVQQYADDLGKICGRKWTWRKIEIAGEKRIFLNTDGQIAASAMKDVWSKTPDGWQVDTDVDSWLA